MKQRIEEELKTLKQHMASKSSMPLNLAEGHGAFLHRTAITTSDLFMSIKNTGICQLMQSAM